MRAAPVARKIIRTGLLPGIIPRVRALAGHGSGMIAGLMALLYRSVNLLPAGHPFLLPANQGRFGVREVIAAAADNLVFSRKNIDQIIIFGAILTAISLFFIQAGLFLFYMLFNTAWAQGTLGLNSLFSTANPDKDMAFSMLDQVFGVPGLFGSEYDPQKTGFTSPFHMAMQSLFAFYSYAMLMVGIVIVCYYILVAIFESAQTGVPFGQRFDSVWAPLRLVVALGLLVPLGYGFNAAQYITLYSAKFGSGLATNGWLVFWENLNNTTGATNYGTAHINPLGYMTPANERIVMFYDNSTGVRLEVGLDITLDQERNKRALLAIPKRQDASSLSTFKGVMETCRQAYAKVYGLDVRPYFVHSRPSPSGSGKDALDLTTINSGVIGDAYKAGLSFYEGNDIVVRYGVRDVAAYPQEHGNVSPVCGELTHAVMDPGALQSAWFTGNSSSQTDISPATIFQQGIFALTIYDELTFGGSGPQRHDGGYSGLANYLTERSLTESAYILDPQNVCEQFNGTTTPAFTHPLNVQLTVNTGVTCDEFPDPEPFLAHQLAVYDNYFVSLSLKEAYKYALNYTDVSISQDVLDRGWAGAAIWYNKIAELNGALVAAANNMPQVSRLPLVMEKVYNVKAAAEEIIMPHERYNPVTRNNEGEVTAIFRNPDVEDDPEKQQIAEVLSEAYKFYSTGTVTNARPKREVNFFYKMINYMIGIEGIYDFRDNPSVHPLAQLTALGRSMLDSAVHNLTLSGFSSAIGGLMAQSDNEGIALTGQGLQDLSGFFSAFFGISLTAGIVLYYIVPFFPFLFFFFGMITWVKSIFEAMVGVPLWALAHLRIQGNGLPGQAASSGYYLIFEIFLRPILIVFGLLAASIIFFTEVYLLHIVFDLVTENLAGSDPRCAQVEATNAADLSTGCLDINGNPVVQLIENVRSSVDQYFFTIVYVILVYLMASSTFKMIDAVPNKILRWMGAAVDTYADNSGDPTQNLTRNVGISGSMIGRQIGGAVPQVFGGIGAGAGKVGKALH